MSPVCMTEQGLRLRPGNGCATEPLSLERKDCLMGTSRAVTERQLEEAKHVLKLHATKLQQEGIEGAACKRNPKWRELDATVRQLSSRLRVVAKGEALNVEVAKLKADKLAGLTAVAEEEAPAPKPKKVKAPAEPAGKGGGPPKSKEKKPSKSGK